MTRDEFVLGLLDAAQASFTDSWLELPDEDRLRLAGMEDEIRAVIQAVEKG